MKRYFDIFNPEGLLSGIRSAMFSTKINRLFKHDDLFRNILQERFKDRPTKTLVLGSATPRNIGYIQDFLTDHVNVAPDESGIYILDRHPRSLYPHKAYAEKDPRTPQVHVLGGDIRAHPIQAHAFDIILSDYTANFLSTEKDWNDFFKEIRHSLSPEGRAIVQLHVLRDDDSPPLTHGEMANFDITMYCINDKLLRTMVEKADLEIEAQRYRKAAAVYGPVIVGATILVLKERSENKYETPKE